MHWAAATYAHLIHKPFPANWGQLPHPAEPFQRTTVLSDFFTRARSFAPRCFQTSVQCFSTILSTDIRPYDIALKKY